MLFKREKYLSKIRGFYDACDLIKVITGVRRCGKSSLMQTIVTELKEKGVSENNIFFFDLDSRKYKKIKTSDQLEYLIDEHTKETTGIKYLFIDEVQNVKNFEEVINAFRGENEYSIFITGSNSYLLSGELATKLTGRYIEFEMYPLTFDEYEHMKIFANKSIDINPLNELKNYILEGGFPRTIFFDNINEKFSYVQSLVNEIFEKDIRKRVKIKNKEVFEIVKNYFINNFGATTSLNNIHKNLCANGLAIGKATISKYLKTLINAKILYECPRFDLKSKKSLSGEKKYYISDLSFYFALNTDNRINYGPVLENIIFLYAKSLNYAVSVGKIGQLECDFILRDNKMNYSYVQVALTIMSNEKTENREYEPLEKIKDNYAKYILTTDFLLQKRNGIHHFNLIEFIKQSNLF